MKEGIATMTNRITKCVAMLAILCVLITAIAAPAFAASYSKVYGQTQDRIRVRASASSSATVIDNIVKGACVYVTDSKTSGSTTFIKVNYRNSSGNIDSGWVCQSDSDETFVKILSAQQAQKTFSVKSGNLPSKKVGTFSASQRASAEKTATTSGTVSVQTIKSVQTMLKELGYYTGDITGNVGEKTKNAIKKFQGEYDLTKDGVAGPLTVAKLESVYNSKGGSSSTVTSSSASGLKLGSTGAKVRDLQMDLTTLGYYWADITGNFGSKTEAAVKNFQEKNNLKADGVAGTKTINAIAAAIARKGGAASSSASGTTLKLNSQGTAVSNLQTDLKQLGYYYADITGNFGSKTEAAVKAFQKDKGLGDDGVAGSKTLNAIAAAIKNVGGSTSDSSSGLKLGSTGDKVRDLQNDLTALGYYYGDVTGHYGSLTQTAVKKFQKAKGLVQDGVAGSTTINAISKALAGSGSSSSSSSSVGSALREGDSGTAVREMQEMLKKLGYYYGDITGSFGSLTKKAVRAFQDAQDLTVDGIAGVNTLNKLRSLTGNSSSSSSSSTSSGATVKVEDSYGRINKNNVNLRSSYSTSSAAKASLDEGKNLRITKVYTIGGVKWYYVTVAVGSVTHKGYIRSDMVTLISASDYNGGELDLGDKEIMGMIRVTGTSVNLREEPSSSSDKVGSASKGEVFYYVDTENGWFQTKAGYWINKDYVTVLSEDEAEDYVGSDTYDGGTYRNGDTGSMVLWIQEALKQLKYYDGSLTGHFGDLTEEAVKDFQKAEGLKADGVAGPKTVQALIDEVSKDYADGSTSDSKYNDKIYNVDWSTYKSKIISGTGTYKLTDIATGRTFSIKIQSAGNHADVEPLKASDTEVLCSLYGVAKASQLDTLNKWQRRAVVMTNGKGEQFVGSIYAIPHGLNTVSGNNYDGQFCVHFKGSTIHAGDGGSVPESENHQAKIKTGVSALTKAGYNVVTTYP